MLPELLRKCSTTCEDLRVPLIVDKTLTAVTSRRPNCPPEANIRFPFQAQVLITGDGLKISGSAVNFDGATAISYHITPGKQRLMCVFSWNNVHTSAKHLP